jgi:stearoyl-CoA desaturase (delta-9 desaturase)
VLLGGAWLYNSASKDQEMVDRLGYATPNDWMERNVYSRYSVVGVLLLLIIETALFNGWGIVMWLMQMAWIPFWAAGVVNGLGHWWGYRNGDSKDCSTNLIPWGIVIGGEELHNNHHLDAANPKLSRMWWEFDIGWFWIKTLSWLKLAKIRTSP